MLAMTTPKSLKSKLIFYFLIITFVPSLVISYFYYRVSQHNLEKNMVSTSINNLVYSMDIIDKQLNYAGQLSDWFFLNQSLDQILTRDFSQRRYAYDADVNRFLDSLPWHLSYFSAGSYVSSLLIVGRNGVNLQAGNDASMIDKAKIRTTDWFQKGLAQRGKKYWYGIIPNPAQITTERFILPLVRPVVHSMVNRVIGWQMIGFNTALVADFLKNYKIGRDEALYVIDKRGFCIYNNTRDLIGQKVTRLDYLRKALSKQSVGYFNARIGGSLHTVVYGKSKLTGWSIIKVLSAVELNREKRILLNITLIILCSSFLLTSFITVYLSNNLTNPLTKLLRQTKAIAAGNFQRDPSIEGQDELGVLGHGINEMAVNIRKLLDKAVEDEQEKRRLELEMLQYQVNPHFLYNALNSLKLMATIQKADGIKEMTAALGRLVMNLSKISAEKISLAEEISFLNDYVYIQNIRYKGKIRLEYQLEREELLQCKIIKFSLQPIVENAVFHGIEPKKDAGRIIIRISEAEGRLLICVADDGVGMTQEQIEAILSAAPAVQTQQSRGLSGIGVKNVDQRIKLTYGLEYGLSIDSVLGEYTKVCFKIPLEV